MTTYTQVKTRAAQSALDLLPELPTVNTQDAWQAYADALDAFDVYDAAHTEADSWDTVIYYYKAMALCIDVPTSILQEAESQWADCGDKTTEGLNELSSTLAYWIVCAELTEAMESLRYELLELCHNQMESLA